MYQCYSGNGDKQHKSGEIPMHYSSLSRLRDLLLLVSLFFLLQTAFERTLSFINEHKKSIIHELDRTFIDEIYTAQRQLHFLEENYMYNEETAQIITDIKERLAIIEEKYKTNSPGVMLLGPIGSVAIVAKEEKLKTKLLDVVNDINKIVHSVHHIEGQFQKSVTISAALESNRKLLHNTATA